MTSFGGSVAEMLASLGASAAGGASVGTILALAIFGPKREDRATRVERVADGAASMSVLAVGVALLEEVLT